MIKSHDVIQSLHVLIQKGLASEQSHRDTLSCVMDGNEIALFIYFWQEHARMVSELEEKVRWLGGELAYTPETGWGGLHFRDNTREDEIVQALRNCERVNSDLLAAYEFALKHPQPVDVKSLLKLHAMKIRNIQTRLRQRLVLRAHTSSLTNVLSAAGAESCLAQSA